MRGGKRGLGNREANHYRTEMPVHEHKVRQEKETETSQSQNKKRKKEREKETVRQGKAGELSEKAIKI